MSKTSTGKTPKGTKVTREVQLDLDDATHARLSKERGEKLRQQAKLKAEFEDVKTKWAERLKPLSDRLTVLDEVVRTGKEKKTLEVTQVKNFDENKIEFWYDGRIVDHRPMNVTDRQEDIPLKTKKGRDEKKTLKTKATTTEDENIAEVHRLETRKNTKRSAVDGPVKNGIDHEETTTV